MLSKARVVLIPEAILSLFNEMKENLDHCYELISSLLEEYNQLSEMIEKGKHDSEDLDTPAIIFLEKRLGRAVILSVCIGNLQSNLQSFASSQKTRSRRMHFKKRF